jgi:hypothetical protein
VLVADEVTGIIIYFLPAEEVDKGAEVVVPFKERM